ncbi:hypothetical protein Tco_1543541, partial [Tanacetum coccineum]
MTKLRNLPKRKVKIPIKFRDSICSLNNKRNNSGSEPIEDDVNDMKVNGGINEGFVEDLFKIGSKSMKNDVNRGGKGDVRHEDDAEIADKCAREFPSIAE